MRVRAEARQVFRRLSEEPATKKPGGLFGTPSYPRLVPRPCRFCGATDRKITREHVWPRWLADFVQPITGRVLAERWSSGSGREEWETWILAATVNRFCDTCNNGWMADIEGTARPIVGPMVQGRATTLDPDAQRTVANWAVLKGLVATQISKDEQPIPDGHYQRVWAAQGAPANTALVWIAQRQNLVHPTRRGRARLFDSHFMPLTNAERPETNPLFASYINEGCVLNGTIFQVGHFFALVVQHDWPGLRARTKPGTDAEGAFVQVWPAAGEDILWPPALPVDGLGDPHQVTRLLEMAPPLVPVYDP